MPVSRDGKRVAQLFRKYRALPDVRACDLDQLLADDGIELFVSQQQEEDGFAAYLLPFPDAPGIVVARNQHPGRRRFSIAHELGHFHIQTHKKASYHGACSDSDLVANEVDSEQREWEANDFAAELLMPWKLFSADAQSLDVSVASVTKLADPSMYNVSHLAAAWRLIQATREAAAVVVSTAGVVTWAVKSPSFRLWLPDYGTPVHADTVAASAFRREGFVEKPHAVPIPAWTAEEHNGRGELLESCYGIGRLDQVVSLLWHVEGDAATDDES